MARRSEKLTARSVAAAKPGRHGDGKGLYLIVAPTGGQKWVYRFTWQSRVTEMGLGSADIVTLAEARDKAFAARKLVATGVNPIDAKREAAKASAAKPSFGECADEYIETHKGEWTNTKHRAQWRKTLEVYAAPLRSLQVDQVDTAAILGVLKSLWQSRPETASRLRGRIELVLDAAKACGHRMGENPAAWKGNLEHLLARTDKLLRGHHAAMPYSAIPAFMSQLRGRQNESVAALALEFAILTAARAGEVVGATWDEIDLSNKVWIVRAQRMKAGREHRVPLSARALTILEVAASLRNSEFVFPGRRGRGLGAGALREALLGMKIKDATAHGFRSAFRDWAGNETHTPREIAEQALAHSVGDATENAYRRGDALEKRRTLMETWAAFCEPGEAAGNVVQIKARG